MAMSQPVVLDQTSIASFVASNVAVVLRVVDGEGTEFPKILREHFDQEYPGAFQFGTFNRTLVKVDAWWRKHFSNGTVVIPLLGKLGQEGYYLFVEGVPITYSSGRKGRKNALTSADIEDAGAALAYVVHQDAKVFANAMAERLERIGTVVADDFESFIRFANKAEVISRRAAQRPAREAPQAPIRSAPPDDFALFGVTSTASNEELRKAHRDTVQKYAPDKVMHMALEFQELATERMKAINAAWERIKNKRGL